MTLLKT